MLTSYIPITIIANNKQIIPVRNIFAFKNIVQDLFLSNPNTVIRYRLKESETPRSLAFQLYSDEKYDWVFYCLNSIINPYYDWPLNEESFYEYIEEKYLDKQCFFLELDSFNSNFIVGETITQGNRTAIIDSWDRTLAKLTVKSVNGIFNKTTITSPSATGIIKRIVRAQDALHHFENEQGVKLDPLAGFLQAYISQSGQSDIYAITNKQYEEKINDDKRIIYILKPDFIPTLDSFIIRNMQQISNYDSENIIV